MARSEWIPWRKGMASSREVYWLAGQLGRDRHEIAGRLMVLWEWVDDQVEEVGEPVAILPAVIDGITGLAGMAEAMFRPEVGLLELRGDGKVVFTGFPGGVSRRGKRGKAASKTTAVVEAVALPPELNTPAFAQVWQQWREDRAARKKPLTPRAEKMQLESLVRSGIGVEKAVECVRLSLTNGWQGIFPDRFKGRGVAGNGMVKSKAEAQDDYFRRMLGDCHEP